MKKVLTILLLSILFNSLLFADTDVSDFKAVSSGSKVILSWKTKNESSFKQLKVQRSQDEITFTSLKQVSLKGNDSKYSYIDNTVFKPTYRTFFYRIKIVTKDGNTKYSDVVSISPKVSGAKQTWGSIKALFQ